MDTVNTQFHVLSFEGPDAYSRAGGIASRITGLTQTLADVGFDTHLWFVGDPERPGHERLGNLSLHRWCQWISRYHGGGVYQGEEPKRTDYVRSLPPYLVKEILLPKLEDEAARAVILAEEWHTVHAVLHLDWLLRCAGVRDRVSILWNANNVFGFDRIDWAHLRQAATITTVSRYMRHAMWKHGVDALVIPNGLPSSAFQPPERKQTAMMRMPLRNRLVLAKVARWDPDKRWVLAVDTAAELKRQGKRPLLIARGGMEEHGHEVFQRAIAQGLRIAERQQADASGEALIASLENVGNVDMVSLRTPLSADACRLLYRGAGVVLANSGHEPFGLVGLEAMAAGGLACTGNTGEDYAVAGWNALVLQSADPEEFVHHYHRIENHPAEERELRRRGRATAEQYAWQEVVRRNLLPQVRFAHHVPKTLPSNVIPLRA